MFYDYHVHTSFSEDSEMPLDEACSGAIERNIVEIAVTDHVDIDYPDSDFQFSLDYDGFSEAINIAKHQYRNRLNIIKGVEIGLQRHVLDKCVSFLKNKDFQFVIASIHAASGRDLHSGDFCRNKDKDTAYIEYLEELLACIKGFSHYNILGHIDIIRRYGDYGDNTMNHSDYGDLLDLVFQELINSGKGLEINTSGFRYGLKSTMPEFSLLKRYYELGGKILTIGSDAHKPSHLAEHFDLAYYMAKEAGFKYLARFPSGEPEFVKL